MTSIYKVPATLNDFHERYGDRMDRISGVLSLMRHFIKGYAPNKASKIISSPRFNLLDERYHDLMEENEGTLSEEERKLYSQRYDLVVKKLDQLVKKNIYQTPEYKEKRKNKAEVERKRRMRLKSSPSPIYSRVYSSVSNDSSGSSGFCVEDLVDMQ